MSQIQFSEVLTAMNKVNIWSLRNHDGDAEDKVDHKTNLYCTYEPRDTLSLSTSRRRWQRERHQTEDC